MKNKHYSIPIGMVFKKHYCAKCGTKLEKEKIHRIVSKDDQDYYEYHDYGTFPRRDYDVYSYRYKCPFCYNQISYTEQSILNRIQKRVGYKTLTENDIKVYYNVFKSSEAKKNLIRNIMISFIFNALFLLLFYLVVPESKDDKIYVASVISILILGYSIIKEIKRYRDK